jgi:hypothetical protein
MIWGNEVHKALELRVKNKSPLPAKMAHWEPIADKFDTAKGQVFTETKWALTRNLTPTTWFAKDVWCRGIIDVGVDSGKKVALMDYKTGKVKHDIDQLSLFAGAYMKAHPYVEQVKTGFIWLAVNKVTRETFTRETLPEIWENYIVRSSRLEESYKQDRWIPKPSGLCKGWCPAGKEHCEFWSTKM